MPHLTTVVGGNNLDVTNATSMYRLFWTDPSLQSVDVANWDVGQVTAMRNMFYGDSKLATLDVTNWDVSQVTTLSGAFESTGIQKLNVANWQTSNMVDLDNAFRDMPVTTLDVSKWNTSKVTDFGWLFAEDYELAQLDVSHFDTSKGTYFWDMFRNDESLTSLDLSSFDTSNATDWNSDALAGLTSLEKITIGPEVVDFSTASLGNPAVDTSNPNNMNTGKWQQVDPILGGTETDPKGTTMTGAQIISTQVAKPTIYVAQKKVAATIHFVDANGVDLFPAQTVTGESGNKLPNITIPAKTNYHVVSDGTVNAQFIAGQANNYQVVYGDDLTTATESEQATRTIDYVLQGGLGQAPSPQKQVVNFTRNKTTDLVTGAVSYDDWQADGTFAAVTSPILADYQADQTNIGAVTPEATDGDQTITVTYQYIGSQTTAPIDSENQTTDSQTTQEGFSSDDQIMLPKTGSSMTAAPISAVITTKRVTTPTAADTKPILTKSTAGVMLPKTSEKKQGTFLTIAGLALVGFLAIGLWPKKKQL
ncbi:BspA family leucine-rich repeat surface protein [Lapidilactobacillus gannanensis]|uniref:BspA family leucine-rich repeat surface protein n=1 Tax=Lapidilactobacillus gannanensis TaxID=2486002 RepID=A0ABW4BPI5_9LACO|nr:BspA family leucine-rich repeat surface protein [Lapidilactobacillus gannanensis]